MPDATIRRTTGSKKRLKRRNTDDGGTGKSGKRRHIEKRRRQIIVCSLSTIFILSLVYRTIRSSKLQNGIDSERYTRGQALKNSYVNNLRKGAGNKVEESPIHAEKERIGTIPKNIGGRYLDPRQLPPLPGQPKDHYSGHGKEYFPGEGDDEWQTDYKSNPRQHLGPQVDYTKHTYQYPELVYEPINDGPNLYPPLEKMSTIFETWGQDDIDSPPDTIVEVLQHFDFNDPDQLKAAFNYREMELPFKVYNVPEVVAANLKWTDEYLSQNFDGRGENGIPPSEASVCQSVDNFFAFHVPERWDPKLLGPPPTTDLEWSFKKWARHAVYADEVGLPVNEKHYYLESGVSRDERLRKKKHWTFVSRDLPSFSSPDPTFFGFNPPEQKGIQCRFGERGVTAATHYDGGRNMIAMITGAKRYILSPPNACPKLGIVTSRKHPSYRHSMLNFGRVTLSDEENETGLKMSEKEKEWLKISADAPTLSTVLKSGEVLYVPSHWFHYIVSLQKSAQCNTRSGIHEEGNPNFGGQKEVQLCMDNQDD